MALVDMTSGDKSRDLLFEKSFVEFINCKSDYKVSTKTVKTSAVT